MITDSQNPLHAPTAVVHHLSLPPALLHSSTNQHIGNDQLRNWRRDDLLEKSGKVRDVQYHRATTLS